MALTSSLLFIKAIRAFVVSPANVEDCHYAFTLVA